MSIPIDFCHKETSFACFFVKQVKALGFLVSSWIKMPGNKEIPTEPSRQSDN